MPKQIIKVPASSTETTVEITLPDSVTVVQSGGTPIGPPPVIIPTGYEGFGAVTTGGDTFPVVHVTTLNPTGAGSLTAAMGNNRKIVFDVKGIINGFRYTGAPQNLTIDGGGITINGNAGSIFAFEGGHDFILKNIRFGGSPGEDAITITLGANRFVIDHCSLGTPGTTGKIGDGLCDITDGAHDGTISYCFFGNSTAGAQLIDYPGTKNITVHHCLYSGSFERNPLIGSQNKAGRTDLVCDFVNNVVLDWDNYGTDVNNNGTANIRNCYYESGSNPNSAVLTKANSYGNYPQGFAYVNGNISGNGMNLDQQSNHALWPVPAAATVTMQDARTAAAKVLAEVGASPRLPQEQALINSIVIK